MNEVDYNNFPKLMVRTPQDVRDWLKTQAIRNFGNLTSEIIRSVRERMEREGA